MCDLYGVCTCRVIRFFMQHINQFELSRLSVMSTACSLSRIIVVLIKRYVYAHELRITDNHLMFVQYACVS
uniref:Uncharacterized protein n=1 Tax=Arundo donax TaxID=35708 RepID=A0A0A9FKX1_ARUDO